VKEAKPFLERAKPQKELEPMKSVDEEDSEETEGASSIVLNLKDINETKTQAPHEQNEQSFRAQAEKNGTDPSKQKKKAADDDDDDNYSQDDEQFESMDQKEGRSDPQAALAKADEGDSEQYADDYD